MIDWIIFIICAVLMLTALISFTGAVIGAYRFGFVMNCMHSAGIGDTLGLFGIVCCLALREGFGFNMVKLFLILVFLWVNSPVSTHFLIQNDSADPSDCLRAGSQPDKGSAAGSYYLYVLQLNHVPDLDPYGVAGPGHYGSGGRCRYQRNPVSGHAEKAEKCL